LSLRAWQGAWIARPELGRLVVDRGLLQARVLVGELLDDRGGDAGQDRRGLANSMSSGPPPAGSPDLFGAASASHRSLRKLLCERIVLDVAVGDAGYRLSNAPREVRRSRGAGMIEAARQAVPADGGLRRLRTACMATRVGADIRPSPPLGEHGGYESS